MVFFSSGMPWCENSFCYFGITTSVWNFSFSKDFKNLSLTKGCLSSSSKTNFEYKIIKTGRQGSLKRCSCVYFLIVSCGLINKFKGWHGGEWFLPFVWRSENTEFISNQPDRDGVTLIYGFEPKMLEVIRLYFKNNKLMCVAPLHLCFAASANLCLPVAGRFTMLAFHHFWFNLTVRSFKSHPSALASLFPTLPQKTILKRKERFSLRSWRSLQLLQSYPSGFFTVYLDKERHPGRVLVVLPFNFRWWTEQSSVRYAMLILVFYNSAKNVSSHIVLMLCEIVNEQLKWYWIQSDGI